MESLAEALVDAFTLDEKLFLVECDLGRSSGTVEIRKRFPNRYVNVGIAEQNAVGVACGIAKAGFVPILHSFAAFLTMRAYEAIRSGIAYHDAKIILLATKGGLENSQAGPTHHAYEDFALMGLIPGMKVLAPPDFTTFHQLLTQAITIKGSSYFRVPRKGAITKQQPIRVNVELGQLQVLTRGAGTLVLFTGSLSHLVELIYRRYQVDDERPTFVCVHTLVPLDVKAIEQLVSQHRRILVIEEHFEKGGLGAEVKVIATALQIPLIHLSLGDGFITEAGPYSALIDAHLIQR